MNAKERRRQKLRRKRAKNSPYSNFSKHEIELINEVKNTPIWKQQNSKLPKDLLADKAFQKEQFKTIIKTYNQMKNTAIQADEQKPDCGCGGGNTDDKDLLHDYINDVLGLEDKTESYCKKNKSACIHVGISFLILLVLIYAVFFKKNK